MHRHIITSMRYIIFLLLCIAFARAGAAGKANRAVVVDSVTDSPLPRASVFDRHGVLAALCDEHGVMPHIDAERYPLSVRFVGYNTATVPSPTDGKIRMTVNVAQLGELVVNSKKRPVLHISAYVREYSLLTSYTDTVMLFREKNVDFMIPTKQEKKFRGWTEPRLLASRSYYHFCNYEGLDSVSDYFAEHFSWADRVGLFTDVAPSPHSVESACDTVMGRYRPTSIWRRTDDSTLLYVDIMTDSTNRKYAPSMSWPLRHSNDFERFDASFVFDNNWDDTIGCANIRRMSFNIETKCRGRRRLLGSEGPVYAETHAEVYMTGRRYISVAEARRLEKRPQASAGSPIVPAADAPTPDPAIRELVARVEGIDHTARRVSLEPDSSVASMKPLPPKMSRWRYFIKSFGF